MLSTSLIVRSGTPMMIPKIVRAQPPPQRAISSTTVLLSDVVVPTEADLPKPVYYVPKLERSKLKMSHLYLEKNRLGGETRIHRIATLCPTRELNFTSDSWALHKSNYRHFRHILYVFRSSAFQRTLFPDLTWVTAVASGVTFYNHFLTTSEVMAHVDDAGFGAATTALGLLVGFRLNASYGRYDEARKFWGEINNTIRDLAGQALMWLPDDEMIKKRFLKLCKAFPMTLVFHLSGKGCHHDMRRATPASPSFADRVHAEFLAELRDIYLDGTFEDDFARLSRVKYTGGNTPVEVLTMMRETIAACQNGDKRIHPIYAVELDEQCQRLCGAFGASERILRTPLPTGFSRHASRLLFIWSTFLPFALYPALGPWGTLPASVFSSYAALGIEDVSVQLEEPFDILPMRQYSDGMFDVIDQMEQNYTPYVVNKDET